MSVIGTIAKTGVGAAVGYGIGNIGGSAFGGNTPGSNIEAGGIAGGIAGAAVGMAAANPIKTAKVAGKVGLGMAYGVGSASLKAAEITGAAALKTAPVVGGAAIGLGATAVGTYGSRIAGIGSKLVKPLAEKDAPNLLGHKASALGVGVYAGTKAIGSLKKGFDDFNRNRMGTIDPNIRRATPRTPSYSNNAGATGDLVFAMNRNRRG